MYRILVLCCVICLCVGADDVVVSKEPSSSDGIIEDYYNDSAKVMYDQQASMAFAHSELFSTVTTSRLGYSLYVESVDDDTDCDVFVCNPVGFQPYQVFERQSSPAMLITYDEQSVLAFDHAEMVNTRTSSRLGYSFNGGAMHDDDCDGSVCFGSGLHVYLNYKQFLRRSDSIKLVIVYEEQDVIAFDHAEAVCTRTSSSLGHALTADIDDDDCVVIYCNGSGLCSCGMVEVSESSVSMSSANVDLSGEVMLSWENKIMIKLRKAWSGMRGQYGGSGKFKEQGFGNMSNALYVHNGGGYDCDAFIWQQLCASGLPPHPGPEEMDVLQMCCDTSQPITMIVDDEGLNTPVTFAQTGSVSDALLAQTGSASDASGYVQAGSVSDAFCAQTGSVSDTSGHHNRMSLGDGGSLPTVATVPPNVIRRRRNRASRVSTLNTLSHICIESDVKFK